MAQLTLKQARDNMRLSPKDVEERTGIPVRTLRRWEEISSSRANAPSIMKLLALYGIDAEHVYFGKMPMIGKEQAYEAVSMRAEIRTVQAYGERIH